MRPEILTMAATFFSAAAQVFFKMSAAGPLLNVFTLFGFGSYAISALIFLKALSNGEISRLYPLWALTFVWVFIASALIFNEVISVFNWAGIALIIAGVAIIGGRKP